MVHAAIQTGKLNATSVLSIINTPKTRKQCRPSALFRILLEYPPTSPDRLVRMEAFIAARKTRKPSNNNCLAFLKAVPGKRAHDMCLSTRLQPVSGPERYLPIIFPASAAAVFNAVGADWLPLKAFSNVSWNMARI